MEGYRNGISQRYIDQRNQARIERDRAISALRSARDTVSGILALDDQLTHEVARRLSSLNLYISQFDAARERCEGCGMVLPNHADECPATTNAYLDSLGFPAREDTERPDDER